VYIDSIFWPGYGNEGDSLFGTWGKRYTFQTHTERGEKNSSLIFIYLRYKMKGVRLISKIVVEVIFLSLLLQFVFSFSHREFGARLTQKIVWWTASAIFFCCCLNPVRCMSIFINLKCQQKESLFFPSFNANAKNKIYRNSI